MGGFVVGNGGIPFGEFVPQTVHDRSDVADGGDVFCEVGTSTPPLAVIVLAISSRALMGIIPWLGNWPGTVGIDPVARTAARTLSA